MEAIPKIGIFTENLYPFLVDERLKSVNHAI